MTQPTKPVYGALIAVGAAALFVPVDSVPWWMVLLPELPGWLRPLLVAATVYIAYGLGAQNNAPAQQVEQGKTTPANSTGGSTNTPAEQIQRVGTTSANSAGGPTIGRGHDGPALQSSGDSEADEFLQTALALQDASAAEAAHEANAQTGRQVTVTGILSSVGGFNDSTYVNMKVTAPRTDHVFYFTLQLPLAGAPVLKAMAPGLPVKARGTISSVSFSAREVDLKECELLRIGA